MTDNIHPSIVSSLEAYFNGSCDDEDLIFLWSCGILDHKNEIAPEHVVQDRIQDILYNNPAKLSSPPEFIKISPEIIKELDEFWEFGMNSKNMPEECATACVLGALDRLYHDEHKITKTEYDFLYSLYSLDGAEQYRT